MVLIVILSIQEAKNTKLKVNRNAIIIILLKIIHYFCFLFSMRKRDVNTVIIGIKNITIKAYKVNEHYFYQNSDLHKFKCKVATLIIYFARLKKFKILQKLRVKLRKLLLCHTELFRTLTSPWCLTKSQIITNLIIFLI